MKRSLIFLLFALTACGDGNKETSEEKHLSTSIVNNPHSADGIDGAAASEKPVMVFEDTLHNFGLMHEGEVSGYEFAFSNTGKTPLVISSASASCGCTVAAYPHDPILPGQSATMKVTFNSAGKKGHQEKAVTIQANTVRNIHMLYIQADIEEK